MKKKGFTLIELLVVVAIVGLVLIVLIPNISSMVKERRQQAYEQLMSVFESAAALYASNASDDIEYLINQNGEASVRLSDLVQLGYLKEDLINPVDESTIPDTKVVIIGRVDRSFGYCFEDRTDCENYFYSSTLASKIKSNLVTKSGSNYFTGANPNNWIEFGQVSPTDSTPLMWRIIRSDNDGIQIIYEGAKNGTSQPTANGIASIGGLTTIKYNYADNKLVGSYISRLLSVWYDNLSIKNPDLFLLPHNWCVSGIPNNNPTTTKIFEEKECSTWSDILYGTYQGTTSTATPYGLFKTSDYLNASSNAGCTGSYQTVGNNNGYNCAADNYLDKPAYAWWTANANSSTQTQVWSVDTTGALTSREMSTGAAMRPVLNLRPTVIYSSGDGSLSSPYKINAAIRSSVDKSPPVLTLLGNEEYYLTDIQTFTDPGATALDYSDGDISSSIVTVSTVVNGVIGTYKVTYTSTDASGNSVTKTRTVHITSNSAPTVAFGTNGNATYAKSRSTTVTVSDPDGINTSSLKYLWTTSGTVEPAYGDFTTSFTNGGTISSPASVSGGYYLWIYAKDNLNNPMVKASNVFNLDNTAPIISLVGSSTVNIPINSTYTDAGAVANDNINGNLTASITVNNPVNTSSYSSFVVTYNVSDTAGNIATQVTRTVNVNQLLVEYLVIGGGGGGGAWDELDSPGGGGGGAGGYRSSVAGELSGGGAPAESPIGITRLVAQTVTIGSGGCETANGANSVFGPITSLGGGKGGSNVSTYGAVGGSGGGAGNGGSIGTGTTGQGYNGAGANSNGGGGGGGAGGAGSGRSGGAGRASSINGTSVTRAYGGTGGTRGSAGGGNAAANTGNGGTGATSNGGGCGGSGIVIVRYPGSVAKATGGTITYITGYVVHTFTSSGTFTVN